MTTKNLSADDFVVETIRIQSVSVPTRLGELDQARLRFFVDNPRVYSIVHENGKKPSQEDIQEQLEEMDHVKGLIQDIKKHGGLIDALVVKDGSFEVVEGNSRLAAYRVLSRQQPAKWGRVRCRLLPADIDDALVASLLGQYHLKGKKEWPPFEQAGYLYRRHRLQNVSLNTLAREAGLGSGRVGKIIEAFELMLEQGDAKRDRWSYYDEFVKSRAITEACDASPPLKARVLKMIKRGDFERAQDVRDKLPVICKGPARTRNRFAEGKLDFDDAFEAAKEGGGGNATFLRLNKFRGWLAEQETQDELDKLEGPLGEKVDFELRKLQSVVASILKKR